MLCNAFSISHTDVPPVQRVRASIERFKEKGGHICRTGFPEGREVTEFGRFQPQWLKRVARRVKREFPRGGFPSDHSIYAAILEITPGAGEQEAHADGIESQPPFWTIFVPLTFHRNQGTTVFADGAKPPPRCRNYMFDSAVQHYGEANRCRESRWVLMLTVASDKSLWGHKVCVEI
jgi:hypothetical protein